MQAPYANEVVEAFQAVAPDLGFKVSIVHKEGEAYTNNDGQETSIAIGYAEVCIVSTAPLSIKNKVNFSPLFSAANKWMEDRRKMAEVTLYVLQHFAITNNRADIAARYDSDREYDPTRIIEARARLLYKDLEEEFGKDTPELKERKPKF